jgi:acyl carrier protein
MAATTTAQEVEIAVYDALVELDAPRDELSREARFEDLEIDSLDLAELSQVVEEKFGVKLRGDDVANIETVGQAIDLVVERAA